VALLPYSIYRKCYPGEARPPLLGVCPLYCGRHIGIATSTPLRSAPLPQGRSPYRRVFRLGANNFLLNLSVYLAAWAIILFLVSILALGKYATQPSIVHPHVPGITMLSVSCTHTWMDLWRTGPCHIIHRTSQCFGFVYALNRVVNIVGAIANRRGQ
jgi:hypothetical protein